VTSRNLIGVVSDTDGLIRPEAVQALRDSNLIIHFGNIGDPSVLKILRTIAPVRAIRDNNDHGAWADRLPEHEFVRIGSQSAYFTTLLNSNSTWEQAV
jgi:uncharacterized protein